VIFINPLKVAI